MTKAIYPGSFDPITNGHIDIINRALSMFEHIVIAVSDNAQKSHLFSLSERLELAKQCFLSNKQVEVTSFEGLLVSFAEKQRIPLILRGLRAASDFEYEYQLAAMNRKINSDIETVFLMTGNETYFLSSRLVREVALLGGDVHKMVPSHVAKALIAKRTLK